MLKLDQSIRRELVDSGTCCSILSHPILTASTPTAAPREKYDNSHCLRSWDYCDYSSCSIMLLSFATMYVTCGPRLVSRSMSHVDLARQQMMAELQERYLRKTKANGGDHDRRRSSKNISCVVSSDVRGQCIGFSASGVNTDYIIWNSTCLTLVPTTCFNNQNDLCHQPYIAACVLVLAYLRVRQGVVELASC